MCGGVQREVCEGARAASEKDRDVLEKGTRAFMSCVRAYKEHQCNFIFRMAKLVRGNVSSHCFVRSAVPLYLLTLRWTHPASLRQHPTARELSPSSPP